MQRCVRLSLILESLNVKFLTTPLEIYGRTKIVLLIFTELSLSLHSKGANVMLTWQYKNYWHKQVNCMQRCGRPSLILDSLNAGNIFIRNFMGQHASLEQKDFWFQVSSAFMIWKKNIFLHNQRKLSVLEIERMNASILWGKIPNILHTVNILPQVFSSPLGWLLKQPTQIYHCKIWMSSLEFLWL